MMKDYIGMSYKGWNSWLFLLILLVESSTEKQNPGSSELKYNNAQHLQAVKYESSIIRSNGQLHSAKMKRSERHKLVSQHLRISLSIEIIKHKKLCKLSTNHMWYHNTVHCFVDYHSGSPMCNAYFIS